MQLQRQENWETNELHELVPRMLFPRAETLYSPCSKIGKVFELRELYEHFLSRCVIALVTLF